MATTVKLKVLLEAAGIKPTTEQLKALNKQLSTTKVKANSTSKSSNELKRNLEGVSQRAGSTGKDFARMSQGMGGLVQAYATVAANVFALSSAFLVLRRAADLSSMIKSAEDFSNRFGVSVTRITKLMQEASGGALSFAEALPSINKAVSAGVGIEQMEKLTIAATKAAQTFGGSTTEALSRFISASQRGRVEIIQTLGVVIKTEQAYKDYAASVGKTALELTAFDRQQAILNATIAESEKVFAGVTIDPNPFQQLLTTVTDLKDVMATFATDALTPVVNLFNKSAAAAGVLIAILVKTVTSRIIPALGDQIISTQAKSVESTRLALVAAKKAKRIADKFDAEKGKTSTNTSIAGIKKRDSLFRKSLGDRIKMHKAFTKQIFNQENKLQVDVLTSQRAAIARELSARVKGKGMQKIFVGTSTADLNKQLNTLNQVGASVEKANISVKKLNVSMKQTTTVVATFGIKAKAAMAGFRAETARAASLYRTGFAQIFLGVNDSLFKSIGRVGRAWAKFALDVATFKGATVLGSFGRAAGRTAGLVGAAFTKALGAATSILIVVELARFAWEKWGDSLKGISKDQREVIDSLEELGEGLDDITKRTDEFVAGFSNSTDSMSKFISNMEFVRGTLDSTLDTFRRFRQQLALGLNTEGSEFLGIDFKAIQGKITETENRLKEFDRVTGFTDPGTVGRTSRVTTGPVFKSEDLSTVNSLKEGIEKLLIDGENFKVVMQNVLETTGPKLVDNFNAISNLLKSQGFTNFGENVKNQLTDAFKSTTNRAEELVQILQSGSTAAFFVALKQLDEGQQAEILASIADAMEDLGFKALAASGNFVASGKALVDTNSKLQTYFSGIDKLKAASVANKEQFNFLIDIQKSLEALQKSAKGQGVTDRLGSVVTGDDLKNIQKFINVASDSSVQDALDKTTEALNVYKALIFDSVIKADKLKIVQLQLQTLKQEEIKSDERRLSILDEIDAKTIERLSLQKDSALLAKAVLERNIDNLKIFEQENSIVIAGEESKLEVLNAQVDAYSAQIQVISESTKKAQETIKIELEKINVFNKVNNIRKQINRLDLKSISSTTEYLKVQKEFYNLQKNSLQLTKDKLIQDIKLVKAKELQVDLENRELAPLQEQLLLLEAQTRELERQQLSRQARESELTGEVELFSKKGISEIAGFFGRELQSQVNKLKSSFQLLGEGFANTVNSTFDTAVDNLLEGGHEFGRTVLEALKAGLRETFGDALKARIRDSLNDIFKLSTQDGEIKARHKGMMARLQELIVALGGKAKSLVGSRGKEDSKGSGIVGFIAGLFGGNKEDNSGLEANTKANTKATGDVADKVLEGTMTAQNAAQMAEQGNSNILSVLLAQLAQMAAQTFSSFFGAANGGVMPGGMSKPVALAAGGIATGPNLALIGEGKTHEAVVPLPNNREIPVDLKGNSGGDININTEQHFDFSNADSNSVAQLRVEARAIEERTFNRVFTEINRGGRYAKISGRR